jgi:hypothetical protein
MTPEEFKNLNTGDIVRSKLSSEALVVTANYGSRVTAVRSADLTNPSEWELIQKSGSNQNASTASPKPKNNSDLEQITKGLVILAKYYPSCEPIAGHEQIWYGIHEPEILTDDDLQKLRQLGWFISEGQWSHHCWRSHYV